MYLYTSCIFIFLLSLFNYDKRRLWKKRIFKIRSESTEIGEKQLMILCCHQQEKKEKKRQKKERKEIELINNHRSQEGCMVYRKSHSSSVARIPVQQGSCSHMCCIHSRRIRSNSVYSCHLILGSCVP